MRILGIETSCDETAIAVVSGPSTGSGSLTVEDSFVFSQISTHEEFGGVVPEVAARLHLEKLLPMLKAHVPNDGEGIDAIAVTSGPGLAPALRTGVETAKTLAWLWKKPLVPLSHLEGHVYANWLEVTTPSPSLKRRGSVVPKFPALCLIVSGGHTELIVMKDHGEFERIGETLDDAAGEAFDKVAQMLGLGYPGGPKIEMRAKEGDPKAFNFPRGLLDRDNFDFSFSGVKTSVLYTLRKNEEKLKDDQFVADVAASFQEAAVDALVTKTVRAAKAVKPASVVLAGGVAANSVLRERLKSAFAVTTPSPSLKRRGSEVRVHVPPIQFSMDNAAMIAAAGYFRAQSKKNFADPMSLSADSNLDF